MGRLRVYSGRRGVDRIELREPAETHSIRRGFGRGDVLGSLGTWRHLALGGSLMVSGDRAVWRALSIHLRLGHVNVRHGHCDGVG
jgi:hypothetical protein